LVFKINAVALRLSPADSCSFSETSVLDPDLSLAFLSNSLTQFLLAACVSNFGNFVGEMHLGILNSLLNFDKLGLASRLVDILQLLSSVAFGVFSIIFQILDIIYIHMTSIFI